MTHISAGYKNDYDDGNIPEIDLPKSDNAITPIPPEFGSRSDIPKDERRRQRKDGPGGD